MVAVARFDEVEQDQRVVLRGMRWQDFEAFLAIRGESKVLPKLDVAWLVSCLEHDTQTGAVRALRAALRKKR